MLLNRAHALLEQAAKLTRERIREEARAAPVRVRELLLYIESNLFDPDLSVSGMLRACGIRDKSMSARFRQAIGQPPKPYIADCRLETASRLLRDTDLLATEISGLLSYSTPSSFSHAFRSWSGQTPESFRQATRATVEKVGLAERELLSSVFWRQAMEGQAEPGSIERLIGRLRALYAGRLPREIPPVDSGAILIDGGDYERFKAREIWREIRNQSREAQVQAVRDRYRFASPVFFEFLLARGREEGRADRQRGVRIAELALESVRGSAPTLREALPGLMARAWAWLGNAHRLALDFPSAEQAFSHAQAELVLTQGRQDPLVKGEVLLTRAALRQAQHRLDEALELLEEAVTALKQGGNTRLLASALMQRGTAIGYQGNPELSLPDYRAALVLVEAEDDPYQILVAKAGLATFCALAGLCREAETLVHEARGWCERLGNRIVALQLSWIEGLIHQARGDGGQAESLFRDARHGFKDLGELGYSAFISLELAALLAEQGRKAEAGALAGDALPILASFQIQDEGVTAFHLLKTGLEARSMNASLIREVGSNLRLLLHSAALYC